MTATPPSTDNTSAEMEARYHRAQTLMEGAWSQTLVRNDNVQPQWIEQSECFWYQRSNKSGTEYRLVDAKALTNKPAFDHQVMAEALALASEQKVKAESLPLSDVSISLSPLNVHFAAFNRHWEYSDDQCTCRERDVATVGSNAALSPDGQWVAFCRDYNLWLRDVASGEERPLTHNGEENFAYAVPVSPYGIQNNPNDLAALWSPDSKRLFVVQEDKRQVKKTPIVNHIPKDGGLRPQVEHYRVAYPGDKNVELYRLLSIDIATGHHCDANYRWLPHSSSHYIGFFSSGLAWWAGDSQHVYFIDLTRDEKWLRLVELDTGTGTTRILFEEISDTYVSIKTDFMDDPHYRYLPISNELIWWSERSGWGHLYLYDITTGELKHAITHGNWLVRDILYVDYDRRELWIQTAARVSERNPYYRDICRLHIDTGELITVLASNDDYRVYKQRGYEQIAKANGSMIEPMSGIAPSGNYLVTTRTRADKVPVTLLLNRDGDTLMEVETTDTSDLPNPWQWPEPVKMTAADGKTAIYGTLFRPSDFSEEKRYPVINIIVSGPWLAAVPHGSFHTSRGYADRYYFQGAALAELGFIVAVIDSRGTPLRDKAFQDTSYGWIPSSANTSDHRTAIENLAERYPSMDLQRVGIFSQTGYQGALQNLMECPDFYKVGVINMHQDSRLIGCTAEADKYQGVDGPAKGKHFPEQLADRWQGKLLLIHAQYGEFFKCYPPAGTFRVVDAFQKANKDVDLLMVPYVAGAMGSYEMRRAWDYLVRHLQGIEPPKEFKLSECVK